MLSCPNHSPTRKIGFTCSKSVNATIANLFLHLSSQSRPAKSAKKETNTKTEETVLTTSAHSSLYLHSHRNSNTSYSNLSPYLLPSKHTLHTSHASTKFLSYFLKFTPSFHLSPPETCHPAWPFTTTFKCSAIPLTTHTKLTVPILVTTKTSCSISSNHHTPMLPYMSTLHQLNQHFQVYKQVSKPNKTSD